MSKDSVYGISSERVFKELLKGKKSKKVIVAIIDTSIDTLHEDLNRPCGRMQRPAFTAGIILAQKPGEKM